MSRKSQEYLLTQSLKPGLRTAAFPQNKTPLGNCHYGPTLELNWGCLHRITCPTVPAGFDSGYLDFYQCYPGFCDFALASTYCFALHMASDYRTLRNQRIKTASMCGRVDEIEWPLHIDQSSHQFFPEAISVFIYHVLISGTEEFYSLG